MFSTISISSLAVVVVLIFIRWHNRPQKLPPGVQHPPNPPTKFLVGNALDFDRSSKEPFFMQFVTWYDQIRTPIFRFSTFGRWIYILNTDKSAHDLLTLKSGTTSSRPEFHSIGTLLSKNKPLVLLPYDIKRLPEVTELWRRERKFLHQHIGAEALKKHSFSHELESAKLVRDLVRNPADYSWLVERYTSSIIFRIAFGMKVTTGQEEVFKEAKHHLTNFMDGLEPGRYLVDTFPSMMNLPEWIAPWKKYLRKEGDRFIEWSLELLDDVNARLKKKKAPHTLATDYLTDQGTAAFSYLDAAVLVSSTYAAGGPSIASLCETTFLAFLHYPEEQEKLQKEIDEVVGGGRMPGFEDIEQLPRLRAVVKEALRWRPPVPAPHMTTEDTIYQGYYIPKGSGILSNTWSMVRDETKYPDGNTFIPDRWLLPSYPTYKTPLTQHPNIQLFTAFGHGRRMCPGMFLAERSVYIAIARIFWAFNLTKSVRPDGKEIPVPWYDFEMPLFKPRHFDFDVKWRDEKRGTVLEKALKEMQAKDPLEDEGKA